MVSTEKFITSIKLEQSAHEIARQFATEQSSQTKAKQVYLNTLAVYTVYRFLTWLGFEIDLSSGDSWNSVIRRFNDVADLVIPNLGKLECRPVLPGETVISLPPEVTEDRIAYIAVQFQEQLNEVQLLGFYPAIDPQLPTEELTIANLQPIEALIDYLNRLESALDFFQSDDGVAKTVKTRLIEQPLTEIIAGLEQIYRIRPKEEWPYAGGKFLASCVPTPEGMGWRGGNREDNSNNDEWQDLAEELMNKLDEIWKDKVDILAETNVVNQPLPQPMINAQFNTIPSQFIRLNDWLQPNQIQLNGDFVALESFLQNLAENLVFRYATAPRSRSAETEDILEIISGIRQFQLAEYPLALVLAYQVETEEQRTIIARLYSNGEDAYLPPDLKLTVLEDTEVVFLEAISRSADNWIQLQFDGEPGEHFSIKIELGDISIMDNFII